MTTMQVSQDVPTGRVEIKGTVVERKFTKNVHSFGHSEKVLVLSEKGFRLWGPLWDEDIKAGATVRFIAYVLPAPYDPKFGFFKRARPYVSAEQKKADKQARKAERASEHYPTGRGAQL